MFDGALYCMAPKLKWSEESRLIDASMSSLLFISVFNARHCKCHLANHSCPFTSHLELKEMYHYSGWYSNCCFMCLEAFYLAEISVKESVIVVD